MGNPLSPANIRIALGVAIAAVAVGLVVFSHLRSQSPPSAAPIATSSAGAALPPAAPPEPSREPAAIPPYVGAPVHALAADPAVLGQVPAETYERSRAELAGLAVTLAAKPKDFDGWMRVAFIKRFYRDYAGAADAYAYAAEVDLGQPLPHYNLGGLYGYYLKDPVRARRSYAAALALDPKNVSYAIGLADFYREVMGDLAAAERVLLEIERLVPGDTNMHLALANFYVLRGDAASAIPHYESALASGDLSSAHRQAVADTLERVRNGPQP